MDGASTIFVVIIIATIVGVIARSFYAYYQYKIQQTARRNFLIAESLKQFKKEEAERLAAKANIAKTSYSAHTKPKRRRTDMTSHHD